MKVKNIPSRKRTGTPALPKATGGALAEFIRNARGAETQQEFARKIGSKQSLLSKYETGIVKNPPANVVTACINIMHMREHGAVTAEELANKIRKELSGADFAEARAAVLHVLDVVRRTR